MFEEWTGSTDRAVDFVRLSVFARCKTRLCRLYIYIFVLFCFFIVKQASVFSIHTASALLWALDPAQMGGLDIQDYSRLSNIDSIAVAPRAVHKYMYYSVRAHMYDRSRVDIAEHYHIFLLISRICLAHTRVLRTNACRQASPAAAPARSALPSLPEPPRSATLSLSLSSHVAAIQPHRHVSSVRPGPWPLRRARRPPLPRPKRSRRSSSSSSRTPPTSWWGL